MGFLDDYPTLQSCLRLTIRPGEKLSPSVEPGESFLMRYRVTNVAPSAPLCSLPAVNFRNPRLVLAETETAQPAGGGSLWLDFPDPYLRPGESTCLDIEVVASRRLLGPVDFAGQLAGAVAAWVTADLDLDALFKVWTGNSPSTCPPSPARPTLDPSAAAARSLD